MAHHQRRCDTVVDRGQNRRDLVVQGCLGVAVTLSGQGALNVITHPDTVPSIPVVVSASPSIAGTAGGTLATIKGDNFTGVTAVTIGGTAVTARTLVDDETLVVIVPAHASGAAAVVVTNATGPSVSNPSITYS